MELFFKPMEPFFEVMEPFFGPMSLFRTTRCQHSNPLNPFLTVQHLLMNLNPHMVNRSTPTLTYNTSVRQLWEKFADATAMYEAQPADVPRVVRLIVLSSIALVAALVLSVVFRTTMRDSLDRRLLAYLSIGGLLACVIIAILIQIRLNRFRRQQKPGSTTIWALLFGALVVWMSLTTSAGWPEIAVWAPGVALIVLSQYLTAYHLLHSRTVTPRS